MKTLALDALDRAMRRGVTYADVRALETRERAVAVKNGRVSGAAANESAGIGIRVLLGGGWGFAATDDLSKSGVERAALLACEIAEASASARNQPVELAPENKYEAEWVSPCAVDPFQIAVEENISTLLAIDRELRRNSGVTLAEAGMGFNRTRQIFVSSLGSVIDQTRTTGGAGFAAHSFRNDEIQKRSYPNSFGGQYQLKGYELVDELKLLENAPRIAEEAVALHSADAVSGRRVRPDSGLAPTRAADPRIDRPSDRTRPRARIGG